MEKKELLNADEIMSGEDITFLTCECKEHALIVEWFGDENDNKAYILSFWFVDTFPENFSFLRRLRVRISRAWNILLGGDEIIDEVALDKHSFYRLKHFINKFK